MLVASIALAGVGCGTPSPEESAWGTVVDWAQSIKDQNPEKFCELSSPEVQAAFTAAASSALKSATTKPPDCLKATRTVFDSIRGTSAGTAAYNWSSHLLSSKDANGDYGLRVDGQAASVEHSGGAYPLILSKAGKQWVVSQSPLVERLAPSYTIPSGTKPSPYEIVTAAVGSNSIRWGNEDSKIWVVVNSCDPTPVMPNVLMWREPQRVGSVDAPNGVPVDLARSMFFNCSVTVTNHIMGFTDTSNWCTNFNLDTRQAAAISPMELDPKGDPAKDKFADWVMCQAKTSAPVESPNSVKGLPADGEKLFNQNGCAGCHSLKPGVKIVGPSLAQVGKLPASEITQSIVNPNAKIERGFASNIMPQNFAKLLSPQQIKAIVAYLQSVAG